MPDPEVHDMPHTVLLASAGSGKTFKLSNRYLQLLRGGARPESILATTFTRKAAGEILGRVLTRLASAAADADRAAVLGREIEDDTLDLRAVQGMLAGVTESIHRVSISTIDSFFNRMASCCRFELGLPMSPRLVDSHGPVAGALRRQAIDAMLGDSDLPTLMELLRRLHHDQAKRSVTDALGRTIADLYEAYRQSPEAAWDQLAPVPPLEPAEVVVEAIDALAAAEPLVSEQKSWLKAWRKDLEQARAHDWAGFLGSGIAKALAQDKEHYITKKPLPPALREAYRPLVQHAKAQAVNRVVRQTRATHDLLARFDAHFRRLCAEQDVVLFSELPLRLGGVVGPASVDGLDDEHAIGMEPLYYRLDGRVQHLLLDEFQDTSPQQWSILQPFAQEITAGEGAREEQGPPRSLFCVGDVKQAIYGWRGGTAEVFDRVMDDLHLPQSVRQTMAVSYRSTQAVLDGVNAVFDGLASLAPLEKVKAHAEHWAQGFEPHTAKFADRPGYVELAASPPPPEVAPAGSEASGDDDDASDDDDTPVSSAEEAHLDFVANRLVELSKAHPGRSIGVLVRRNKIAAGILDRLRRLGLHASGEGGAALINDPAVELVASALTLADHPGHTVALHHVRHSPLGPRLGLDRDGESKAVERVAAGVRRSLVQAGYAATLTAWARALAPSINARSARRLEQLIALAEQYDPVATLRAMDFVDWIDTTRAADPAPAVVRVMTTHGAKGLEFDIVVLAELEGIIGSLNHAPLWVHRPTPTEAPDAVFRSCDTQARAVVARHDDRVEAAYDQEVGRRVADDLSALYVAMTRARHALYMLLRPLQLTDKGKLSTKGLSNCTPASVLRHALANVDDPAIDGVLYTHGDPAWDTPPEISPARSAALPEGVTQRPVSEAVRFTDGGKAGRSWAVLSPSRLEAGGTVNAADLLRVGGGEGRSRGTSLHAMLAKIEYVDGLDPAELDPALVDVLGKPAVRAALVRRFEGEELWRERDFAVRDGQGRLIRGAFDRVAIRRDPAGKPTAAHLVDFKTDAVADDPEALSAKARAYQPQIAGYRAALSRMLGLDADAVTAELVMIGPGRSVAV